MVFGSNRILGTEKELSSGKETFQNLVKYLFSNKDNKKCIENKWITTHELFWKKMIIFMLPFYIKNKLFGHVIIITWTFVLKSKCFHKLSILFYLISVCKIFVITTLNFSLQNYFCLKQIKMVRQLFFCWIMNDNIIFTKELLFLLCVQ